MGQRCMTCKTLADDPRLLDSVNRDLVTGRKPIAAISREIGVSKDSLRHHKKRCVHYNLVQAQADREANYYEELRGVVTECVMGMRNNVEVLRDVINRTKKKKHYGTLTKAMKELRGHLELGYKMLAHMTEAREAEDDIVQALHWVFGGGVGSQIVEELTTEELKAYHKALSKVVELKKMSMGVELDSDVELGSDPVEIEQIDVEPVVECETCAQIEAASKAYATRMIRTKAPANECDELDSHSTPDAPPAAPTDAETQGDQPDQPDQPAELRPPLHSIHFESAQAYVGHTKRRR